MFPPLSAGDSKLGEVLNLIKTVTESEVIRLKSAASTPDEIVTVADSETLIVAALAEVAMFSAAEKEEDEVKVGEVVSIEMFDADTGVALVCSDAEFLAKTLKS